MAKTPSPYPGITVALTGSDQAALTGGGTFFGGCFYESAGSNTATATIHDGTAASGTIIAYISLAASGVTNLSIPNGVQVLNGIYVDVAGSGTIGGSVFYAS